MQFSIHRFERVTSTNTIALQFAEKGAPEGTVIIAREQTAGRGRFGRNWVSPLDSGLYLTIVFRPKRSFEELWQLAFVCSLAVAETIECVSGLTPGLKWPNDVMLNGRKVCGLLVEIGKAVVISEQGIKDSQENANSAHTAVAIPDSKIPVVVGIGINVNNTEFPEELANQATSLALEAGKRFDLHKVEQSLLGAIEAKYVQYGQEGFPPILTAWREYDITIGSRVAVHMPGKVIEGTAVEIDGEGNLVVRRLDGTLTKLLAGDVNIEFSQRRHL